MRLTQKAVMTVEMLGCCVTMETIRRLSSAQEVRQRLVSLSTQLHALQVERQEAAAAACGPAPPVGPPLTVLFIGSAPRLL